MVAAEDNYWHIGHNCDPNQSKGCNVPTGRPWHNGLSDCSCSTARFFFGVTPHSAIFLKFCHDQLVVAADVVVVLQRQRAAIVKPTKAKAATVVPWAGLGVIAHLIAVIALHVSSSV